MALTGLISPRNKWSYGPLLITGDLICDFFKYPNVGEVAFFTFDFGVTFSFRHPKKGHPARVGQGFDRPNF